MKIVTTTEIELGLDDLLKLVDQRVGRVLAPAEIICQGRLGGISNWSEGELLFPIKLRIKMESKV